MTDPLEIMDNKGNSRLLFPDGQCVVSEWDKASELLLRDSTPTKCLPCYETDRYKEVYLKDISFDLDGVSEVEYDAHEHTDSDINDLLIMIESSERWNESDEYVERVAEEIEFFERSKNILFLMRVKALTDELKRSTVVGVGRGSACASLVMYILGIHDINPILYDIKFSELSKGE